MSSSPMLQLDQAVSGAAFAVAPEKAEEYTHFAGIAAASARQDDTECPAKAG